MSNSQHVDSFALECLLSKCIQLSSNDKRSRKETSKSPIENALMSGKLVSAREAIVNYNSFHLNIYSGLFNSCSQPK